MATQQPAPDPFYGPDYNKHVSVFDLFLPVDPKNQSTVRTMLDRLFDESEVLKMRWLEGLTPAEQENYKNNIMYLFSGYSISEVDGRFKDSRGNIIHDSVWQVRLIVDLNMDTHDTKTASGESTLLARQAICRMQMWKVIWSEFVLPYAQQIKQEDEFWFLESAPAFLTRYSRSK